MNPETQKFIPPQEEKEKEFEIDYEPFDPEAELKNLRKGDKEMRAGRLEEYKKELIRQKEGIAEIQENLEKQLRENPDLPQEELMKIMKEFQVKDHRIILTANRHPKRIRGLSEELVDSCYGGLMLETKALKADGLVM